MGNTYASRNAASREVSFYNYKKYLSIILFAMVDAHLRFTYMEVGAEGKCSDATIYNESELFEGPNLCQKITIKTVTYSHVCMNTAYGSLYKNVEGPNL